MSQEKMKNRGDQRYKLLLMEGSALGKTNSLLILIKRQTNINKIYLYVKDLYEAKYQLLFTNCENVDLKYCCDPKAFIEYLSDMKSVYNKIEEYNTGKKQKILIVFADMIADMINKKSDPTVNKLFIRYRKLNISVIFISHSCFAVPT